MTFILVVVVRNSLVVSTLPKKCNKPASYFMISMKFKSMERLDLFIIYINIFEWKRQFRMSQLWGHNQTDWLTFYVSSLYRE